MRVLSYLQIKSVTFLKGTFPLIAFLQQLDVSLIRIALISIIIIFR